MKTLTSNGNWKNRLFAMVAVLTVLCIMLIESMDKYIPRNKLPTSTRPKDSQAEVVIPFSIQHSSFAGGEYHRPQSAAAAGEDLTDTVVERLTSFSTTSIVSSTGSLTATSRGQTTLVTRLSRDTIFVFDPLGEFTVEHGAALRQLLGDDVEIIVKVPARSPLGKSSTDSRFGGDGSFVPGAAMSGQWMMQDTLHMLLEHQRLNNRNISSRNGTDDAFGAPPNRSPTTSSDPLVIVVDFRRADLRCASPFEQLRLHFQALRNNQQQQQRRQKQSPLLLRDVVFLATPPVRDPLDVSEVVTNFHRTSALWKMSFEWRTQLHREQKPRQESPQQQQQQPVENNMTPKRSTPVALSTAPHDDYIHQAPSMLPELHHILYYGRDSWRQGTRGLFFFPTSGTTPSRKQLVSSAFYAGTSTSLLDFLSAVCDVIGCIDCDVDTSLPLEPILTHLYISWMSGGTVPPTMQRDSLLLVSIRTFPCAQRKSVDPLQCQKRMQGGRGKVTHSASFLVIDTTPDCMAERSSLHKKGLFRSLKRVEVAATLDMQQSPSPPAVQPLLPVCVAQYQLSGHPVHHGVVRLRVDVDDKESIQALKSMKPHTSRILDTWGNWRRSGYWTPHHKSLRQADPSAQTYENLLPRFPATACPAGELGSESTVIITMATRCRPHIVSAFVHTFLRTQERLRGCSSGGNGTQFPTVLVAVVSDPADFVRALLTPGMWRGSGRPPPVVFLSLAVWNALTSTKFPSSLQKCKVVISRFPTFMMLLRVIATEWNPTYAMMADARDVLFQTNVGEAIAEINTVRTNEELPVVYGSVPLISRDREVRHRSRDSVRRPNSQNTGDEQRLCKNATGASPALITKDNFVAIVLERGYLNSPDLFAFLPFLFNRLWLAQTFGDAFGWRVTETSELRFEQRNSSRCTKINQSQPGVQRGIPFPIACAGVFFGTITGVINTMRLLTDTLLHTKKCKGNDQGVLVALAVMGFARSGFPHDVLLLDPYYGKFTHGFTDDAGRNMRMSHARGGGKLVTNCHGMPYAVLHQIDRHEGPYKYLVSSINDSLPH